MHLEGLMLAAQARMAKGETDKAVATLTKAAEGPKPSREVYYNLGEVKFAKGNTDESFDRSIDRVKTVRRIEPR